MPKAEEFIKNDKTKVRNKFIKKDISAWDDNMVQALTMDKNKITNISAQETTTETKKSVEQIETVNPRNICNWQFHDRPETELGDIQGLANDFLSIGQQQPCIVRPNTTSSDIKYELIVGERRWRAATLAQTDLKVIVKNLSDTDAALSQVAENDNRVDLSDYAKGMSFAKLIDSGVLKQKDLIEKLGRSKQYVSSLLSYSKIPDSIIDSVQDWSKVSTRTAEKIKQLSSKGQEYIDAIISIADKITNKGIGAESIEKMVARSLKPTQDLEQPSKKVFTPDGRHVFTWRQDNNGLASMHFPKNINEMFNSKINLDEFTKQITDILDTKFKLL
jgi:ParB family chromosome partitioning protein